ncbi:sigma-70 family RNA polymerase sigma factor [Mucilaginibacter terrigena]|uniref:Sigma-70 family RNA polymerase sigma factor n=1 Tax=Mucilaginibacter terrigena TaxID=2492395 RepID=A0A4Q5LPH2_9SPHI|nr:sigma-70 family RNA polymerase sigma factor [Mucilaginibacter terrigena]RYU91306.1 sigma-70 family RNA polymerase sigma factor [Mucilaginibacter terrigena]
MVKTANREQSLMELYKSAFPAVAKYVARLGGSFDDARDVFQDALVIYYEKAVCGNLNAADDKAYLLGIAKHLWFKKFREGNGTVPLHDELLNLADEAEGQVSTNKVLQYLQTAGKRCMELLSAFYYDKLPMKEAAEQFGYAGERSVTVQKYKCLEKVRDTVKQRSLSYADFIE